MCRLEVAVRAEIQDGRGGMYERAADNRDHQWWQCTIIEKLTSTDSVLLKCLSRFGEHGHPDPRGDFKRPVWGFFLSTGDRRFACLSDLVRPWSDKTLTIGFCQSRHEWSRTINRADERADQQSLSTVPPPERRTQLICQRPLPDGINVPIDPF